MVLPIAVTVVLHLSNPAGVSPSTLVPAKMELARVYRDIGIDLEWSRSALVGGDSVQSIHVVLVAYEAGRLRRRAETVMGAAMRTAQGTKIAYIFYRRIESEAAQYAVSVA